jgi:hypothetical protein
MFSLTSFLLDIQPPLITDSSQLFSVENTSGPSPLTLSFFEALTETFPWFSAVDKGFRLESVDLACRMLRYAVRTAKWELPLDIVEQLDGLVSGAITSQLEEGEKKRLIMWNSDVEEEDEEESRDNVESEKLLSTSLLNHGQPQYTSSSSIAENSLAVTSSSSSLASSSSSSVRPQKIEYFMGSESRGSSMNSVNHSTTTYSTYKEVDSAWLQMAKARKMNQSLMKKPSRKVGAKSTAMKLLRSEVLSSTTAPRIKSSSFPAPIYNSSSSSSTTSYSQAPRYKVEIVEPSADLSSFHDSLTPEKPKRSMQKIDLPNAKKSATEKRLDEKSVSAFKPKPLGDISSLHMQILSWEFPPEEKLLTPPNFDSESLKSIRTWEEKKACDTQLIYLDLFTNDSNICIAVKECAATKKYPS